MMRQLMGRTLSYSLATGLILAAVPSVVHATPYASGVTVTGTSVSFILNQPTATLTYSINGGAPVSLSGATNGTKSFTLGSPTDKFSITATDSEATGFLIPNGTTVAAFAAPDPTTLLPCTDASRNACTGLSVDSPGSGFNLISNDASTFSRYNSPRGVDVNKNPNTPYFGTAYVLNSATGTLTGGNVVGPGATPANVPRTLAGGPGTTGEGLYAVKADESDAFGNGDAPVNPINVDTFAAFLTGQSNSGYRLTVAPDGKLFVADYSDANGQLFQVDPNISIAAGAGVNPTAKNVFAGFGGPFTPVQPDGTGLPAGQNHGSISSVVVTGSLAAGNLVVYAVDEDLNSVHVAGGTGDAPDRNSLWKWNVGSGGDANGANYAAMPTQLTKGISTSPAFPAYNPGLIGDVPSGGIVVDMVRSADGSKFYMTENRAGGTVDGLIVSDATGAIVWDSLAASRTVLGDPNAHDILTGAGAVDISPDGKYLAIMQIDNDVTILPLVNGLPDLANRLVMDNGSNTGNGRDIAFDAAGNLYTVSSGTGMYRVLSPGGNTTTTLSWDGTAYSFTSTRTTGTGGVPGDYNGNGVVDMADYVLWRNGGPLQNDNTPGTVDASDYDFWRAHFGNHAGAGSSIAGGAAVPEPGSVALVLLGLLSVGGCRKRSA